MDIAYKHFVHINALFVLLFIYYCTQHTDGTAVPFTGGSGSAQTQCVCSMYATVCVMRIVAATYRSHHYRIFDTLVDTLFGTIPEVWNRLSFLRLAEGLAGASIKQVGTSVHRFSYSRPVLSFRPEIK
jgi:hypothetical protein